MFAGIRILVADHDLHRVGAGRSTLTGRYSASMFKPTKEKLNVRNIGKVVFWSVLTILLPLAAFAEGGDAIAASSWGYGLGAGLAVGLAALGCGIGQGLTAGNTTAGIARNPGAAGSMFTNFILGMVLIESIAIYGLVVGLLLVFAIPS